ncbi:MAG TPA: lysophospholipase [Candidatus Hydrogenedentes bacterium]|nr:lysophospholipase [Candidatus Hydrogenedentota bacterium]
MMKEDWFDAAPQVRLYERRVLPEAPPLAQVVIVHGYGDHSTRYAWTMDQFCSAGIATYAYDQRGHGHSPGKRGYIPCFEDFLDDLDTFLEHIKGTLTDAPLFLMGHSMGGMVLARYAETRALQVRGLVFSSPFLAFSEDVPKFLIALGPIIAKVLPCLPISKVDNRGLSRDPAVIEAADQDPLCYHGGVAAHTAGEFYRMVQTIEADAARITPPMLVLHGGADHVVSPGGSKLLHEKAGAEDKTLRIFPDGYHELFNDLEKEEFMAEVITWIKARV